MSKYIISVCTSQLKVVENAYSKTLTSKAYEIDDDYDFGAIDPKDLVIDLYNGVINKHPGISELTG